MESNSSKGNVPKNNATRAKNVQIPAKSVQTPAKNVQTPAKSIVSPKKCVIPALKKPPTCTPMIKTPTDDTKKRKMQPFSCSAKVRRCEGPETDSSYASITSADQSALQTIPANEALGAATVTSDSGVAAEVVGGTAAKTSELVPIAKFAARFPLTEMGIEGSDEEEEDEAIVFLNNLHSDLENLFLKNVEKPELSASTTQKNKASALVVLEDGVERIEAVLQDGQVSMIQLAVFHVPVAEDNSLGKICNQGNEYLYIHDEDRFLGRGSFTGNTHLDFTQSSCFHSVKNAILKEFRISYIVTDSLVGRIQERFKVWLQCLNNIEGNLGSAIEISKILVQFVSESDKCIKILKWIACESKLPTELKEASNNLYLEFCLFQRRSNGIGCFSQEALTQNKLPTISNQLQNVCDVGLNQHCQALEKVLATGKCTMKEIIGNDLITLKSKPIIYLQLRASDIQIFLDIENVLHHKNLTFQMHVFLFDIWTYFLKSFEFDPEQTIAYPIYSFLLNRFLNGGEILGKTMNIDIFNGVIPLVYVIKGLWGVNKLMWPRDTKILCLVEEHECRFLAHMLGHVKPGVVATDDTFKNCSTCSPTSKQPRSWMKTAYEGVKSIFHRGPENRCIKEQHLEAMIWKIILNSSLDFLLKLWLEKVGSSKECAYEKLLRSLEAAYQNYVDSCDSFESCRETAQDIVRFSSYMLEHVECISGPTVALLRTQTKFVSNMMEFNKHGSHFIKYFPQLIFELVQYWENRKSFDAAMTSKFTFEVFISEMITICDDLHATLNVVLLKDGLPPELILDFLRGFNEFLTYFQHIDFVWLVEIEHPIFREELDAAVGEKVQGQKTTHFRVNNQAAFLGMLDAGAVPKHYLLAVVRRLVSLVVKSLADGDEKARVKGMCSFLTAIRWAFIHFEDQIDYVSFEQFEKDIYCPFEKVAEKIVECDKFEQELENLEKCYIYTRKQNEIDINTALKRFEKIAASNSTEENNAKLKQTFDGKILIECFNKYDEAFNLHISDFYRGKTDIVQQVIQKFRTLENQIKCQGWDEAFRREKIPVLLAGVSAYWSLKESIDMISIGQSIKPNCIQILCILRLLNVDQPGAGLQKHLAEILTGQGKSLVLALLASVLALTGHTVQVLCYNKYLARRDELSFKDFFGELGIEEKVCYGTFDMYNKFVHVQMNGKTLQMWEFIRALVLNELEACNEVHFVYVNGSEVLLIDEVDVFVTKAFGGTLSMPAVCPGLTAIARFQVMVWDLIKKSPIGITVDKLEGKAMEFIKHIIEEKSDEAFCKLYESTSSFIDMHLRKMVKEALLVSKGSPEDWYICRFRLNEDGFVEFKQADGFYGVQSLSTYFNTFNYFRLKGKNFDCKNYKNFGYLNIRCGQISYTELPNEVPVILGVSSTLSTLSLEENVATQEHRMSCISHMPTFSGHNNLRFCPHDDFKIAESEEDWQGTILESILSKQTSNRSVIVFFDKEEEIEKFTTRFRNELTGVNTLTGNEAPDELERRINDAGVAGRVTFTIRAMGRGVDYKSSLVVEQNGGIHVIQTFLSLDVKEEVQIRGRTARTDNRGSYELILCNERLITEEFLSPGHGTFNYVLLNDLRKQRASAYWRKIAEERKSVSDQHNKSVEMFKSFSSYKPHLRAQYLTMYPFSDIGF